MLPILLVLLGAGYSYYLGDTLRYPDERDYYALALNLSNDHSYSLDGLHQTAFRPPGYPLILAAFTALTPSIFVLRMVNFIALAISSYILYSILRTRVSGLAGIIAGLLVYCYPILFYTAGLLYPQTIASALLLGCIYLAYTKRQRLATSIGVGLLFGSLILMIPTFLGIFVLFLLLNLLTARALRFQVVIAIVALLLVAPWTIRNYLVFHSFVLVSSNSGINLLLGNSENTTANAGVNVDITNYDRKAGNLDEIARDSYYRSQAIRFILNNRSRAAELYLLKVLNHFNYRNELATQSESSHLADIVMLITYGFILLLTLIRVALAKWYTISKLELVILLMYVANALMTAIFFTRIRFRLPFDMLLMIVVATFLGQLIQPKLARHFGNQNQSGAPTAAGAR